MKIGPTALTLALVVVSMNNTRTFAQTLGSPQASSAIEHAHVVNTFRFEVAAPMTRVARLFAPEAERAWAGKHWDPVFLYPQPGRDVQGAVWTIKHGPLTSVWVNTVFDIAAGRMQYVAVVGNQLTMTVDVRVTSLGSLRSQVEVTYARTALDAAANDQVRMLGEKDRTSGPDWQHGIEAVLELHPK